VDFMPYEGGQLEGGHDSSSLILVVAIGAILVAGAWGLAAVIPVPLDDARMIAPSLVVANVAATDDALYQG
jgi:hypothetical protein